MIGRYEYIGEQSDPRPAGAVRINTFYETRRLPAWHVALKLVGSASMIGVGLFITIPLIPLATWQSLALASGLMLLYVGFAFFVRPEPNGDNMGFLGGFVNDPFHFSDNINRGLWKAHCCLGPGRFIAETILDCCTLLGLTAEISADQASAEEAEKRQQVRDAEVSQWRQQAIEKVQQRQAELPAGQLELSSARFFESKP
jgi:hypothetical protein